MDSIGSGMKGAEVVDRHPETVQVFLRHDCPDKRSGLFRIMSYVMSVRWAARIDNQAHISEAKAQSGIAR